MSNVSCINYCNKGEGDVELNRGGDFTKNQYSGGDCLKSGAWKVSRFVEGTGLTRMRRVVFSRGS